MRELGINEKAKQQACEDGSQVGGCFCEFDSQHKSTFSFFNLIFNVWVFPLFLVIA